MNTKITALTLAAATAFAFTPKPASAHDNAAPIIAGAVIGGLIGLAVANADHHSGPAYVDSSYCPPAPGYAPNVYYAPAPAVVADGYWTTAPVSVWVAPTWVVTNDYYGHSSRHYVAGHYETHNDRRWVSSHGHDNRGHEVARGYGNERHDNNNNRRDDRRDHR